MKIHSSRTKLSRVVYSALLSVAGAIIGLLALGTIFALLRPSNSKPLFSLGKAGETGQASGSGTARNDDVRVFSGLGRLRIPLSNSSTLVLSIAFPYSAGDTAFTEELAGKIGEFRVIASDYFSSLPAEKLVELDEETAKQEILGRINAGLRLGRIEALYFSDLLIIEGTL
ncbi:MAG: flagellar basal body protein FliL [Treponema sp.]|nr:flagellar basal body protein FliL [Treponema sp.]